MQVDRCQFRRHRRTQGRGKASVDAWTREAAGPAHCRRQTRRHHHVCLCGIVDDGQTPRARRRHSCLPRRGRHWRLDTRPAHRRADEPLIPGSSVLITTAVKQSMATGLLPPAAGERRSGRARASSGSTPTGQFFYAAIENGDTIIRFAVDTAWGGLTPTGQVISVGRPVTPSPSRQSPGGRSRLPAAPGQRPTSDSRT